ncbi:MAG: AAA family ATPase, partial [Elusimicrobiota bacterium]|jgi:hypothetical protein|nr:AAA family ATPase [Elusimicrobiota bacterium]
LEKYFKDYIGALAKNYSWSKEKTLEAIKFWYGGYSWDGKTSIYNPTSILKLFSENTFSNYWLAGARSNFLPDIFKKENYCEFNFGEISVSDNFFSWPSGSISRLFQMGYLTVCAIKRRRGEHFSTSYILGWPNEEVKLSFARKILESLPKGKGKLIPLLEKLKDQIVKSFDTLNAKDMQKYLPSIYACIPQNKLKAKRGPYLIDNRLEVTESNYAAFFVFALKFLDFDVFGESRNFRESKNIVIKQAKQTIIAEVKYDEKSATLSRKVDSVLKQMKKQKYWENHICPDKKIVLLGLAFGDSGKTAKCKFEEVK